MNIIGLNAFGQNPSACLIIDGNLVGFSHEERFNRLKCSHNMFPFYTIKWLLTSNNLTLNDIDFIAFSWDCNKYPTHAALNLAKQQLKVKFSDFKKPQKTEKSRPMGFIDHLRYFSPDSIRSKIKEELSPIAKVRIPKIEFIDHHLSHAYQAYCHSSFNDAIVLVADGHGEENTISAYSVVNKNFKKIINYKIPFSLGWFYSGMTSYLGFNSNRDEGKLMGLAAYGEKRKNRNKWIEYFDELVSVSNNELSINPNFFKLGSHQNSPFYSDFLIEYITNKDNSLQPIKMGDGDKYLLDNYVDLAYATQYKLEEALVFITKQLIHKTGIKDLCIAGGIGLNCKANQAIYKACELDNIFIHPAASDDGAAIGAAFVLSAELGSFIKAPLQNAFNGASFSNDEIENVLKNCGLKYLKSDNICKDAARLLSEESILGWFQGCSEMGARALGARSIIANPFNLKIKDKINLNVKYRETWRPYCPSILSEYSEQYLSNAKDAKFMNLACDAKDELIAKAPAVVHVDNTVRPQCVNKEDTPLWHNLLNEFNAISDAPVLLNTSFNVRGEPIVNSPYDAIRTFYSTGLNALVLSDFIIKK